MKALFVGSKSLFDGSSLATSTSGLFCYRAPQGTAEPFVVYEIISGPCETDSDSRDERPLIQFSIWSDKKSPSDVIDLFDEFIGVFDDADITVSSGNVVSCIREDQRLTEETDDDGNRIGWQYQADYRFLYETDR